MVRIDGLKSERNVQADRLGQLGIRFQPDLSKSALAGRFQEVFEKLFAQTAPVCRFFKYTLNSSARQGFSGHRPRSRQCDAWRFHDLEHPPRK